MAFEASDEPKFSDDDEDDLPLSAILPISSLRKCSDEIVKKRSSSSDDSNNFQNSVKKPKVEVEEDDVLKRRRKQADKPFSMFKIKKFVKEQLELIEKSIEEFNRKEEVEEKRLQSLKRDISKCSKELASKKIQVREINQVQENLLVKIEECAVELVGNEAQMCLMEDLIGEQKLEYKTAAAELHQVKSKENEFWRVMDNIDKDCEVKQEELRVVSFKIAECSKELRIKEKELDAMKELMGGQVREHESKVKHFEEQVKELESREKNLEQGMEELESKKRVFEGLVEEFEAKEREFKGQKEELQSENICFEGRVKELESKEKQLDTRMKEFESKKVEFQRQVKEYESKEVEFERLQKELKSEKMHFESRVKELESKQNQLEGFVENLIREEQHVAAVRFICAYDLIDKYQPFNLLRDHMQNAKLISESSCKKTNSIQIKDKARDEEIACLKTVLDCISDNNLKSECLLNEIQFRIFELIKQKGK